MTVLSPPLPPSSPLEEMWLIWLLNWQIGQHSVLVAFLQKLCLDSNLRDSMAMPGRSYTVTHGYSPHIKSQKQTHHFVMVISTLFTLDRSGFLGSRSVCDCEDVRNLTMSGAWAE